MNNPAAPDVTHLTHVLMNYGEVTYTGYGARKIQFQMCENTIYLEVDCRARNGASNMFQDARISLYARPDITKYDLTWCAQFTLGFDRSMDLLVDHICSVRETGHTIFSREIDNRIIQSLHLDFNLRDLKVEGSMRALKTHATLARMFISENAA